MYLSQLELNTRNWDVRRDLADCQRMHCRLLRAFPQTNGPARQDFGLLYRIEVDGACATVLVQSKAQPDWSELPTGYLAASARSKPLNGAYEFRDGDRLRFRLQANPTRKVDTKSGPDGKRRNGRREAVLTEEKQLAWLERKGEMGGFELLQVRASPGIGAGPQRAVPAAETIEDEKLTGKHAAKEGKKTMTFGSVRFDGELRVTDADRFRQTLVEGIGSGKAYGFGLLSVAPLERK